ncbi:MAG: toll/interleukin-1 receptor domain-containing protein, partial [Propionivibrio sp.]
DELERASCVLVLWSAASVKSDWVKEEASEAARRKTLIPVLIDEVTIPLGFRRIQAAVLVYWKNDAPSEEFEQLVRDIAALIGDPGRSQAETRQPPHPSSASEPALVLLNEAETPPDPAVLLDQGATTTGHSQREVEIVSTRPAVLPATSPDQSPQGLNINTVAKKPVAATTSTRTSRTKRLLKVFRRYCRSDRENFHVAPDIPLDKLDTARRSCMVPKDENVLALIDLTIIMKHAKDCVLFGDRSIYHYNLGDRVVIPYSALRDKAVKSVDAMALKVGSSSIATTGPSIRQNTWVKLFNDIKSAVGPGS